MLSALLLCLLSGCAQLEAILADSSILLPPRDTGTAPDTGPSPRTTRIASDAPPPIFGDWWYYTHPNMQQMRKPKSGDPCLAVPRFDYPKANTYVPVNVPGGAHGGPTYLPGGWYSWFARCYTEHIAESGAPVGILIRERNCPFPYATNGHATSPREVEVMLDTIPRLDYLFMDLEPFGDDGVEAVRRNVTEIVRLIRSHPNPQINNAFIGNYEDWPGTRNEALIWPNVRDRTNIRGEWNRDEFYREHLNVAMPIAYPYETYSRHSHRAIQKDDVTPNDRAAMLWAPVERVSVAARNLPEGHLLIPWVSNFVEYEKGGDVYNAPPPSREDLEALIRHLRLRGAYSFMVWTANRDQTDHPTINHQQYRELAMNAWRTLDPAFPEGEPVRVLNLETEKTSGVVWSGIAGRTRAWVLVSNLGPRAATVELPTGIAGLPRNTPSVPPGQHRLFRFPLGG